MFGKTYRNKKSKVTPVDLKNVITKKNSFIQKYKRLQILQHFQIIMLIQAFVGINRLHLLKKWKFLVWFAYCISAVLVMIALYLIVTNDFYGGSSRVHKDATCIEFILLSISSTFMMRLKIRDLFSNLEAFDDKMNIRMSPLQTFSLRKDIFLMMFRVGYTIAECTMWVLITSGNYNAAMPMVFLASIAHDSEQAFYCALLKIILDRVKLIKAHISKLFNNDDKDEEGKDDRKNIENLNKNADLDTTAIHRAYEQLHKCAEQLNFIMSFPMIVMLFSSGLSTIVLLKFILHLVQYDTQDVDETTSKTVKAQIVYSSMRCIKYTILVIIPCYYCSITTRQIGSIRTMLHDAITNLRFDKIERRKVKALSQLIHDNEFTYALWRVIRLNMSLPLSYFGICTTYLVIIIQFSKFIDQNTIYEIINYKSHNLEGT